MKDFAVVATVVAKPVLTLSTIEEFCSSDCGTVAVLGAGSPANLERGERQHWEFSRILSYPLIWHYYKKSLTRIFVCL